MASSKRLQWLPQILCLVCSTSAFLSKPQLIILPSRSILTQHYYHPAVEGWEQKYIDLGGGDDANEAMGPKILSATFEVHAATEAEIYQLGVNHWPVWTTGNKEKWNVGNQIVDKEMPYGELSYVTCGKLEIIPADGDPVIITMGDFVTFPRGFVASWRVLEELSWNYYLY